MRLPLIIAVLAAPTASLACSTITDDDQRLACYDEHMSSAKMIRCTDLAGDALCEVTSSKADVGVSCVAYDASNKPIARGIGMSAAGIIYTELNAKEIDHLDCEAM